MSGTPEIAYQPATTTPAPGSMSGALDLEALHPEQRRRRILEHDPPGFLISEPVVRPKIVGAASSLITATRP